MNSLKVAFEKAEKVKKDFNLQKFNQAEQELANGILEMRDFMDNYKGKYVSRSPHRVAPVEDAIANILSLYNKRDVCRSLKQSYSSKNFYNGHNAKTSYTPDVLFKDFNCSGVEKNVFRAVEVRCGEKSIEKNTKNNTTNLLGRRAEYNQMMDSRSGLVNRPWFCSVGVYCSSVIEENLYKKIIEESLFLYEFCIPTALIFYDFDQLNKKVIFRHDLVPYVIRFDTFLEAL